jgi:hypothetical protein
MRRDSTPQERQFKPMDVACNQDLVKIWNEMLAPPPRWPSHLISLTSYPCLYRRLCGGIVHPRSVNLSLWTSLAVQIWWRYGLRCSPPPQMAITPYISRILPRPLPTIMRRYSTPQERQFKPMDVTCSPDLVEIWLEMLAPPQMANTAYSSLLSPRPLATNMRQHITPQVHQFGPMDVTRNQDLVELWADKLAVLPPSPLQMALAPYIALLSPRLLPTNMRQHSTLQRRQFKPMNIPRSQELVVLWVDILALPPTRTAQKYISATRQSPLCGPFLKCLHPCLSVD